MNPINDHGIRTFKVTVSSASATPAEPADWLPFFEEFGGIDKIDASRNGNNEFFLTYRSTCSASLLRSKHEKPLHINGRTIAFEPAESQPTEPFDYLKILPTPCLESILSCLGRYDLIRFSQVSQRAFDEVCLEMNRRKLLLSICEWQAMKYKRLIFDEDHGPTSHSFRLLQCMKGIAEKLEFHAYGGYSSSENRDWLNLIEDAAVCLRPMLNLRSLAFSNIRFNDMLPTTAYLPLFTNLTHLSLYRVNCPEQKLWRFLRETRTLRKLELRDMRHVTGTCLIDVKCRLAHLSFIDCPDMVPLDEQLTFLDHNSHLISLKWRRSPGIALNHFWEMARRLTHLQTVDIDSNAEHGLPWYFTLNNLAALPCLRQLRLRLNPNYYASLITLRPLFYRNQLELLDINGGVLENALLDHLSHATNLHTLILTHLNTDTWEPYIAPNPLSWSWFIDLGTSLTNLRHFAISIWAHPPFNSGWLLKFVENATQLETLEFKDHNYLFKLLMMGKLIEVCKRRQNNIRLIVIVGSTCHENLLTDSKALIDNAQANDVIGIRRAGRGQSYDI